MNSQSMKSIFDYHIWANHQVWDCLESISAEQFMEDIDYSRGSIQSQFFHLMQSDDYVPIPLERPAVGGDIKKEDFMDMAVMRAHWDQVEANMRETIASTTDEQLQATTSLPAGETSIDVPVWEALLSIINHGTNHRAQILMQLHKLGGKTVEQGLYFYMIQR